MVQGAVKYLNDLEEFGRIHLGQALQQDADDLLYRSDSVHNFVMDCVKPLDGGSMVSAEAYQPYIRYCNDNGFVAVAREAFFRMLAKEMQTLHHAQSNHRLGATGSMRGYRNFMVIG